MAPIFSLPQELVDKICSHVEDGDYATLSALCRTNITFYKAASPSLYRCIDTCRSEVWPHLRSRKLQLLCRTLVKNRTLAQHPREVQFYLHEKATRARKPMVPMDGQDKVQIALLLRHYLNLPAAIANPIIDSIIADKVSEEAFFVLLLVLCPRLETLTLHGRMATLWRMDILGAVLNNISKHDKVGMTGSLTHAHPPGIYRLQNLVLDSGIWRNNETSTDLIMKLSRLPALRKVTTTLLAGWQGNEPNEFVSGIEEINVYDFVGDLGRDFSVLLRNTPELKFFNLKRRSPSPNDTRFCWQELGRSLVRNCPKLQQLSIDHPQDDQEDDQAQQDEHVPGMGSLKTLKNLEKLTLPVPALFGTPSDRVDEQNEDAEEEDDSKNTLDSLLPDSIKELTVLCHDAYLTASDQSILEQPGAEKIEHLKILNRAKTLSISNTDGLSRSVPSSDDQLGYSYREPLDPFCAMILASDAALNFPQLAIDLGDMMPQFDREILDLMADLPPNIREAGMISVVEAAMERGSLEHIGSSKRK